MSSKRTQEKIEELLETFTKVDKESQARLFKEINKELEAFLSKNKTMIPIWETVYFIS